MMELFRDRNHIAIEMVPRYASFILTLVPRSFIVDFERHYMVLYGLRVLPF
jgi:hypothetical protein